MTYRTGKMTTRNAKNFISDWIEEGCEVFLEARIDTIKPMDGYMVTLIPAYDGNDLYRTDQRLLYLANIKQDRAKMIKTREGIFKLAEKYGIPVSRILWR